MAPNTRVNNDRQANGSLLCVRVRFLYKHGGY